MNFKQQKVSYKMRSVINKLNLRTSGNSFHAKVRKKQVTLHVLAKYTRQTSISMNVIYVQDDGQRDRRDVNFSPLLEQYHACLFQLACRKEGEHVSRNHPRSL